MSSLERIHHRYWLAPTAALATVVAIVLLAVSGTDDAAGGGLPIGNGEAPLGIDPLGDGTFDSPVNTAFAPGEPDNVYVVEQDGRVQVLVNENEQGPSFLNLQSLTNANGEQGLLGLAFHPNYQANDLVYAYYTDDRNGDIVVAEFHAPNPLNADEGSRRQVIRIRHRLASNHNGGQLLFGPDGRLYMGTGDGGGAGDPQENAQDKRSLLGKLLRINPIDPPGPRSYSSPRGNPFKGRRGKDAIFARGLRNPFRFSFDGSRIAIGDVGQDRFEEVDYESKRGLRNANFGWDRFEGRRRFNAPGDNEARTPRRRRHHDKPIHVYGRGADGGSCSLTGGVVVRDQSLLGFYGRYLFADFCAGRVRSLVPTLRGAQSVKTTNLLIDGPTSFTNSPHNGEVYVTSFENGGEAFSLVTPP